MEKKKPVHWMGINAAENLHFHLRKDLWGGNKVVPGMCQKDSSFFNYLHVFGACAFLKHRGSVVLPQILSLS